MYEILITLLCIYMGKAQFGDPTAEPPRLQNPCAFNCTDGTRCVEVAGGPMNSTMCANATWFEQHGSCTEPCGACVYKWDDTTYVPVCKELRPPQVSQAKDCSLMICVAQQDCRIVDTSDGPQARCVPKAACECSQGQTCRLKEVECLVRPCPVISICDDSSKLCGNVICSNTSEKCSAVVSMQGGPPRPRCVPFDLDCICEDRATCTLQEVICVMAPCLPVPTCRGPSRPPFAPAPIARPARLPNTPLQNCNGITCDSQSKCVELMSTNGSFASCVKLPVLASWPACRSIFGCKYVVEEGCDPSSTSNCSVTAMWNSNVPRICKFMLCGRGESCVDVLINSTAPLQGFCVKTSVVQQWGSCDCRGSCIYVANCSVGTNDCTPKTQCTTVPPPNTRCSRLLCPLGRVCVERVDANGPITAVCVAKSSCASCATGEVCTISAGVTPNCTAPARVNLPTFMATVTIDESISDVNDRIEVLTEEFRDAIGFGDSVDVALGNIRSVLSSTINATNMKFVVEGEGTTIDVSVTSRSIPPTVIQDSFSSAVSGGRIGGAIVTVNSLETFQPNTVTPLPCFAMSCSSTQLCVDVLNADGSSFSGVCIVIVDALLPKCKSCQLDSHCVYRRAGLSYDSVCISDSVDFSIAARLSSEGVVVQPFPQKCGGMACAPCTDVIPFGCPTCMKRGQCGESPCIPSPCGEMADCVPIQPCAAGSSCASVTTYQCLPIDAITPPPKHSKPYVVIGAVLGTVGGVLIIVTIAAVYVHVQKRRKARRELPDTKSMSLPDTVPTLRNEEKGRLTQQAGVELKEVNFV